MSVPVEAGVKLVLLLAALSWLAWQGRAAREPRLRLCLLITMASIAAWANFGGFHEDGSFLNDWDQYHYFLASRYYPELGYDGLYVATIAARAELDEEYRPPSDIRDVRSGRFVPYESLRNHQREVRRRFSDGRWESFLVDVGQVPISDEVFTDHGYNALPPWTGTARWITSWLPFRWHTMLLVAALDIALLGFGLWLIRRSYGWYPTALVAVLFGIAFLTRYSWLGGCFLRFDWFFAVVAAVCALRRGRPAWAGAAMGYAIGVRLFPAVLLVGLGAWGLASLRRGFDPSWIPRFACALLAMLAVLGLSGAGGGRGLAAYADAVEKLREYRAAPNPANIGLRTLLITSVPNLRGDLSAPPPVYDSNELAADYRRLDEERRGWLVLLALVGLAFTLWAAARAPGPAEALLVGMFALFCLVDLEGKYWLLLTLMPLYGGRRAALVGVLGNLAMAIAGCTAFILFELGMVKRLSAALVFYPCSWIVLATLISWLLGQGAAGSLRTTSETRPESFPRRETWREGC